MITIAQIEQQLGARIIDVHHNKSTKFERIVKNAYIFYLKNKIGLTKYAIAKIMNCSQQNIRYVLRNSKDYDFVFLYENYKKINQKEVLELVKSKKTFTLIKEYIEFNMSLKES